VGQLQPSSMRLPAQGGTPAPASGSALYISLAVAGAVIVLLLVLFLNSSPPPPAPAPPSPRPAESRKPADDPALKAVTQAREFSAGNPHAVDERVRIWEQAVVAAAKSVHAEEARKGLERAVAQRREEVA